MSNSINDLGSYKTDIHYAVIGEPTAFYVWGRDTLDQKYLECLSGWIKGDLNLFQSLKRLRNVDPKQFCNRINQLKREYPNT